MEFIEEGVTSENACSLYGSGPEGLGDGSFALKFIEDHAKECLQGPAFMALPKDKLLTIVKSDRLCIEEVELFDAVLMWGRAEALRLNQSLDSEGLKGVLADFLPHIRFPLMQMEQVAAKVGTSGLLAPNQLLQIFTYLGSKGASGIKTDFNSTPRAPRKPKTFFKWDKLKMAYGMIISEDGLEAKAVSAGSYLNCYGDTEFKDGVVEFEVTLSSYDTSNGYNVLIGVVPGSDSSWSSGSPTGYNSMPGWMFICGNGQICTPSKGSMPVNFGSFCVNGDRIGVRVDIDAGSLEYFKNSKSLGVAFTDIRGPIRGAISLVTTQTVKLGFQPDWSKPSSK